MCGSPVGLDGDNSLFAWRNDCAVSTLLKCSSILYHASGEFNEQMNVSFPLYVVSQARTKLTVARAEAAAAARYQPPPTAPVPRVSNMPARVGSGGQTREALQRHAEELRRQLLLARQSQHTIQSHGSRGDSERSPRGERIMLPHGIAQDMKHLVRDGVSYLVLIPNCWCSISPR